MSLWNCLHKIQLTYFKEDRGFGISVPAKRVFDAIGIIVSERCDFFSQ